MTVTQTSFHKARVVKTSGFISKDYVHKFYFGR